MSGPRAHVWPWLRAIGRLVLPNWLAITLGRHIFAWRPMNEAEMLHELAHVDQWRRHGWTFPLTYAAESMRVRRRGGRWYHDNRFEQEARTAAAGGTHRV